MVMASSAIPAGVPQLIPYLTIDGAERAIEWYKKALGAELVQKTPGPDGKGVMHCEMKIGTGRLYFADPFGADTKSPAQLGGIPFVLHLWSENCDVLWKRALDAGAKVKMPIADMFWGDRYGQIQDPFGFVWALSTQKETLTDDEIRERAAKEFGG